MAWNANWTTSEAKGKLLKPALNDLRAAMNERCLAVGRTVPANCPAIVTGDIITSAWHTAFQAEVTTLIPLYANHTDNSGDWDGETSIPAWSEATILTALGDVARLPAPTDPLISASWMWQQFRILNLLRWTYQTDITYYLYRSSYPETADMNFAQSVVLAAANWNANGWTNNEGAVGAWVGTCDHVGFYYETTFQNFTIKLNGNNYATPLQASYDFYIHTTPPTNATNNVFWSDAGYLLNKYNRVQTIAENGNAKSTTNELLEKTIPPTPAEPIIGSTSKGYIVSELTGKKPLAIVKFDGANGFTFKD